VTTFKRAIDQRELVTLRHRGWSLTRIAEHYGVSKQRVHQIIQSTMPAILPLDAMRSEIAIDRSRARRMHEMLLAGVSEADVAQIIAQLRTRDRSTDDEIALCLLEGRTHAAAAQQLSMNVYAVHAAWRRWIDQTAQLVLLRDDGKHRDDTRI
jgi:DNA-directed RNA polymerase specialized sigma24 family protein